MASVLLYSSCLALVASVYGLQSAPSIEADGSNLVFKLPAGAQVGVVDGSETETILYPVPYDDSVDVLRSQMQSQMSAMMSEMRSTSASTIEGLQSQIADLQSNLTAQVSDVYNFTSNVNKTLSNTSFTAGINENNIAQLLNFKSDTNYEIERLSAQILDVFNAFKNDTTSTDLNNSLSGLQDLVDQLREPNTVVVRGAFVRGDDKGSNAACPSGLRTTSCEVEIHSEGSQGNYQTDGIRMTDNGCVAYASARGANIRSKLTCDNIHKKTQIVQDNGWKTGPDHNITCPQDFRTLHCMCWSAWGACNNDGFGFSPISGTTCQAKNANGRIQLSAICINND